jgi:NADH-ubiquinone oxidoreductase chain 3
MNILIYSSSIAIILATITLIASIILSSRSQSDREKSSPFECGFDPKNLSRIPFSLRFFLLALIFLVFDIEVILLLPVPLITISLHSQAPSITALVFIIILVAGLLYE